VKTARLTERDDRILREVVRRYVATARPVSSGSIARSGRLGLSSATVRNVLRSLEDRGLIFQPHTSAGRVPTDRGYRYYVDHLMSPADLTPAEKIAIRTRVGALGRRGLREIVAEVSRLMSESARQLAITMAPAPGGGVIEQVELVALSPGRVLAVAATRGGLTRSVVLEVSPDPSPESVRRAADLVRSWLSGSTMAEAAGILEERVNEAGPRIRPVVEALSECAPRLFTARHSERVHYDGARYIFGFPEFAADASVLGGIFDSENALAELLEDCGGAGAISVRIGRENRKRNLRGLTMVVGSYRVGSSRGHLGVIGPTRMRYARVIGLVDHFSKVLDELFAEAEEEDETTEGSGTSHDSEEGQTSGPRRLRGGRPGGPGGEPRS